VSTHTAISKGENSQWDNDMNTQAADIFSLRHKVVVITGAAGVLCSGLAAGLCQAGATVALCDINYDQARSHSRNMIEEGFCAAAFRMDVLDKQSIALASQEILKEFGRVDILINGAGGNRKEATTSAELSFFELPEEAIHWVFNLNFMGSFLPCQVFGEIFAQQKSGVILNISSMNALRPLTRIPAYSAAKAAITNFTQWLAVHLAQNYAPQLRVNAIAPGFFLTEQNRFLLTNEHSNGLTQRGETIISHTPQNRFGEPSDLLGTVLYLVSSASDFVTGITIAIDGGFSAFSGV